MKRITMLSCGSLLCVAVTVGLAQQPETEVALVTGGVAAHEAPVIFGTPAPEPTGDATAEEAPQAVEEPVDPEVLRQEYLQRMQEKAALMDEAELKSALHEADQDIAELTAQRRLEEAQEILAGIAAEFPQTDAGARARTMLRAGETGSAPLFHSDSQSGPRTRSNQAVPGGYQPL